MSLWDNTKRQFLSNFINRPEQNGNQYRQKAEGLRFMLWASFLLRVGQYGPFGDKTSYKNAIESVRFSVAMHSFFAYLGFKECMYAAPVRMACSISHSL